MTRDDARASAPNKLQMFVFGTVAAAAGLRLVDSRSGGLMWVNILIVAIGVVGFAFAAFRPLVFDPRSTRTTPSAEEDSHGAPGADGSGNAIPR